MPNDSRDTNPQTSDSPMVWRGILTMGVYFVLLAVLTGYLLVELWPERVIDPGGKESWSGTVTLFGGHFSIGFETRLILLVMAAGALGSYVHAATSFSTYVGNRTLIKSWVWWYLLRTPIGVALALLFYFVVRGGLLSAGASGDVLSPFGLAAIGGLTGKVSQQDTDMVREVFDNIYPTTPGEGDSQRKDKPS